ncbi:dehydrogenase [Cenarchaeum symbiosum A]|uniref:Dehydrogenase n=1 Tax=Cenarchaeum symbiosum (strain A) TaxID=414004 RepID=A0RUY6_CENSY|nr:dehydrogenase [Cenarchaeum symbiosum A]
MYDVAVAGGSIAGLLCAREAASSGLSVVVLEEDHEIGTPDHCGGLVSSEALGELGLVPGPGAAVRAVQSARLRSPGGKVIDVDSSAQNVLGVDRRALDKQAALQAQRAGAEIRAGVRCTAVHKNSLGTVSGPIPCKVAVDARGLAPLALKDPSGVVPSAQYEVYADWTEGTPVEVILDSAKYPGFFAWVIPSAGGSAKVGAAGRGINAGRALGDFLKSRGRHSILRRVYAPLWTGGPADEFIDGAVAVGDAAGQAKPTTSGGIYTCGMGGVLAGRAIASYIATGELSRLQEYPDNWKKRFGKEFARQMLLRRLLERMDNAAIDGLFDSVGPGSLAGDSDFDFHTDSIVGLLGLRGSLRAVRAVLGGEARKLLG